MSALRATPLRGLHAPNMSKGDCALSTSAWPLLSQFSALQVNTIHDALSLGQELQVKVMGHDQRGNLQISHKALTEQPEVAQAADSDAYSGSGASQKPYQATNARFQQSGGRRNQRDHGVQKPRIPQTAVADGAF